MHGRLPPGHIVFWVAGYETQCRRGTLGWLVATVRPYAPQHDAVIGNRLLRRWPAEARELPRVHTVRLVADRSQDAEFAASPDEVAQGPRPGVVTDMTEGGGAWRRLYAVC